MAASSGRLPVATVDTAAGLLALAVSYRHSVARHGEAEDSGADVASAETIDREVDFIAGALTAPPAPAPLAR